jgi:hypothetical protein
MIWTDEMFLKMFANVMGYAVVINLFQFSVFIALSYDTCRPVGSAVVWNSGMRVIMDIEFNFFFSFVKYDGYLKLYFSAVAIAVISTILLRIYSYTVFVGFRERVFYLYCQCE